jgi:hypothetical protein
MIHLRSSYVSRLVSFLFWTTLLLGLPSEASRQAAVPHAQTPRSIPTFQTDPSWPKPLPNNWILGGPASVAVDGRDHVWILHRPLTAPAAELATGKKPAPPVVEFDPQGNLVQAWGGPDAGHDWPKENTTDYPRGGPAEHGIYVDHKDNIWITGNGDIVLKYSRSGTFLMQIGEFFKTGGSNDTRLLGNPADVVVDPTTNELFVADGYLNRRVVVFDADTGKYKRHWGAYGKKPDDGPAVNYEPDKPLPQQFFVVHCIRQSKDGLIYVCDRQRDRLQVFRRDGTFIREAVIAKDTPAGGGIALKGPLSAGITKAGIGSVFRVGFSADPQQEYLYVGDSTNNKIWILRRSDLQVLGSFEARGLHHLAGADSKGNLYSSGMRLPGKFAFKGVAPSPSAQ